jgi:hypothetical protein
MLFLKYQSNHTGHTLKRIRNAPLGAMYSKGGFGFNLTFSGLAKVAIFTTNVDAENRTLINLRQGGLRSTEPPLLPNPCYKLPFLSFSPFAF